MTFPSIRFQGKSPLEWPTGWKRTPTGSRTWARFRSGFDGARIALLHELGRLGADSAVLSTNLPLRLDGMPRAGEAERILDPGVAVRFTLRGDDTVIALACDRWLHVGHNVQAIAKHVEAMRGMERWGVGSIRQAMAGYAALPASSSRPWWEVLGVSRSTSYEVVRQAWRERVKTAHPDVGGDRVLFQELSRALEEAERELVPTTKRSAS